MKNVSNKERFLINMVKGVTIFLMLWGHCIQYLTAGSGLDFFENDVFKCIYSFHMPLFMLVSGYLFFYSYEKRNLRELLVHRIQALIQPIVFGSIFIWLVTDVLFSIARRNYDVLLSSGWFEQLSSLWFLWSVLAASVVVAILGKKINNLLLQVLCFILGMVFVVFFPNPILNLYMYPYFLIGFLFAKFKQKCPNWLIQARHLSIVLFPVLLCFFEKKHYIYTTGLYGSKYDLTDEFIIDLYRWIIGFVGAVFVITVLEMFYRLLVLHSKMQFISNLIAKLGTKSLQIYVLSVPFLSIYLSKIFLLFIQKTGVGNMFVQNMFVFNFVVTFGIAIVYAVVLYWATELLEKIKVGQIVFGR